MWPGSTNTWVEAKPVILRATLCVSAVFTVVRCLSVRLSDLSVTLVDYIHTAEYNVKYDVSCSAR